MNPEANRCTTSRERGWEGLNVSASRNRLAGVMRPCVSVIQASTGPVQRVYSVLLITNASLTTFEIDTITSTSLMYSPSLATMPTGGWLGSGAEEGRAKLR
jgi:hypothetical protein